MFYTVFTLDLEQRASTTLLSVSRLPSDLFKVVALPPPVGGTLLIGSNEVVHVDENGSPLLECCMYSKQDEILHGLIAFLKTKSPQHEM